MFVTPPWVAMVQAHADQAEARRANHQAARHGRRAGDPIDWPAELVRARDRNDARHTNTHRKEQP